MPHRPELLKRVLPKGVFNTPRDAEQMPSTPSGSASTGPQGRLQAGFPLPPGREPLSRGAAGERPRADPSLLLRAHSPAESVPSLAELPGKIGSVQAHQIGSELGGGDEKTVYRLKPPLHKFAIGVFHSPSGTLEETRTALAQLTQMGLPVVDYSDPIIVKVGGTPRQGVFMDYVEGGVSGKDLRSQRTRPPGVNVNGDTFADLDRIEATLRNGGHGAGVAVWDLDLMVGMDGRVRLFDPAAVVPVDPGSGRGQTSLDENLKLIADLRTVLSSS